MKRKKNVVKGLIEASIAAFYAGVEIHNKPKISFRYPTSTMLMMNAWELALKAYIYKYINKKKIYEGNGHTISFSKSLNLVHQTINHTEGNNSFNSIKENLFLLIEYRNNNAHYFSTEIEPIIFMLLSKSTISYNIFLEKYFKKDLVKEDNLIILPIGFKLPFDPIVYLSKKCDEKDNNSFVLSVIECIKKLQKEGVEDSIVIGFDMMLNSVKKLSNADIIAGIDNSSPNSVPICKKVRFTQDSSAPAIRLDEAQVIIENFPLTYKQMVKEIKKINPSIKQNSQFNLLIKSIKQNKLCYMERLLNPLNINSPKTGFYSKLAVDEIIRLYE